MVLKGEIMVKAITWQHFITYNVKNVLIHFGKHKWLLRFKKKYHAFFSSINHSRPHHTIKVIFKGKFSYTMTNSIYTLYNDNLQYKEKVILNIYNY